MTGHDELIETVEVHIKWLRHTPPCACDSHDVDNRQSADYLERLVAVGHAFAAKVEELRADATTLAEARQLAHQIKQPDTFCGNDAEVWRLLFLLGGDRP